MAQITGANPVGEDGLRGRGPAWPPVTGVPKWCQLAFGAVNWLTCSDYLGQVPECQRTRT